MLSVHERRAHEGFSIYAADEADFVLVMEGIDFLLESDPARFNRALRHLPSILCSPLGTSANRSNQTLYLNPREFNEPVSVALALVYSSMQSAVATRYPRKEHHVSLGQRTCARDGEHFLRRAARLQGVERAEIERMIAVLREAHGPGPYKARRRQDRHRSLREIIQYARGRW
ncbi:hypothetical protein OWM54_33890 [Myxococcus sp. MISCRS1]|uniref:hypothetical protein n=1 Tax=Myxococcus sp. MISCRS1 TaxID=2996786 RepID=UPI00226FE992|nr:hypothetical protein [Myxococcus sp. MISCRS1]MCY1002156.1 hypothetical protein [Myxococcus sp. MISCRS1]